MDPSLTTGAADFIDEAVESGNLFIEQPYSLYSGENQETWKRLYALLEPLWRKYANGRFLQGVSNLMLNPSEIPRLEDVNKFLEPMTRFEAKAVSGYVPAFLFFDCLRKREFPTTITVRDGNSIDYLPEPDIFHDIAGHVPMHTDKKFADVLVKFGEIARTAALRAQAISDQKTREDTVKSNIRALARFFWFTVEFGLMNEEGQLKAYGSGLLSSAGELQHSIESNKVQRFPLQIEWAINQQFEIDHYQELLFIVDSFEHLFDQIVILESFLNSSRLDNVSAGEPVVNAVDLDSFIAFSD